MIGQRIGDYLVQKKLGNGAMGSVYLALDTVLDRPVALKFILSDFNDHPDIAKRFLAEAKVLASLNRPNIPILYSYLIWEGKGVMAMEYVDGPTLESLVLKRGPIPADVCVPYIKQALRGLAAAHRIGVVHRDLKPSNLMLNKEETIKVVDFGIAKKIEDEAGLTGTNATIGTPWYMAPEQIQGKPVTARTDIYSMGVVLYQLLAGQVPFHADSIFEIHTAHVQQTPEPPTLHYPHIPKEVVDAVMKALQKRPDDRFQSAEEFLQALPDLKPAWDSGDDLSEVQDTKQESRPPQPGISSKMDSKTLGDKSRVSQSSDIADSDSVDQGTVSDSMRKRVLIGSVAAGIIVLVGGGLTWTMAHNSKSDVSTTTASIRQPATNKSFSPVPVPQDEPGEMTPAPKLDKAPSKPPSAGGPGRTSGTEKIVPPPPDTGAKPNDPPVAPAVVAGQELSGPWQGIYTDSNAPQDKTAVRMQVQEGLGGSVSGSLTFLRTDRTSGTCTLSNSVYYPDRKKLKILLHCSDSAAAPKYFNTPTWLTVADPTEKSLTGKIDYFPTVTVDLRRMRP